MSFPIVLSAGEQIALDAVVAPDFHAALVNNNVMYFDINRTYRCASAAVPKNDWFDNDPCPQHGIIQPPQWLADVENGQTDVLVLDGLYALSTNLALLMPVLAALGDQNGIIIVLNMNGTTSVYDPTGLFWALQMLGNWLEDAVDYHGPGGQGPGDDPDHGREAVSMLAAAAVLRKHEYVARCTNEQIYSHQVLEPRD